MAFSLKKILKGILIREENTITPKEIEIIPGGSSGTKTTLTSSQTTTNKTLTLPDATDTLVAKNTSDILTNKSIDADTNTITNIENADIKAVAAIDATKIANGVVSNAEFQQLDGLTSPAVGTTQAQTLTTKTIVVADNTVTTVASGNLVATELNTALSELQSDIDTRATITQLNDHINDITDAHDASAISNIPSGNLAATDVQSALNELQSDIDTRATSSALTTHTSASSGVHGITGSVVGTTDTQTLTNKTLTSPLIDVENLIEQGSTPSTPSSGNRKLYAKSDGIYQLTSGGIESKVGSGSGGDLNLITDGNADDVSTSIFVPYADTGLYPVDGVGGSPSVTTSVTSTNPLTGVKSYLLTKPASTVQGEGWAITVPLDKAYRAKVLKISFDYILDSGTFNVNDIIWTCYDITNSKLVEPSSIKMLSNSTDISDVFESTVQFDSNCTSFRLIAHIASVNAGSTVLKIDNVTVSPSSYVYGTPITDWQPYTPTFTGLGTITSEGVYYRRVGDSIEVKGTVANGTVTGSALSISLPSGLSIDPNKLSSSANTNSHGLLYSIANSAAAQYPTTTQGPFVIFSDTSVNVNLLYVARDTFGSRFSTTGASSMVATAGRTRFEIKDLPILGWSSSVQVSDSYNGRKVFAKSSIATAFQIPNAVNTLVQFNSIQDDSINAFTNSGSRYNIKTADRYKISVTFNTTSSAGTGELVAYLYINGGVSTEAKGVGKHGTASQPTGLFCVFERNLNAGDYVEIYCFQNFGSAIDLRGNATAAGLTSFCIERTIGSGTISATDSVNLRYGNNAGTSVANTGVTTIPFGVRSYDSHGSFVTDTFTAQAPGKFNVKCSATFLSALYAAGNSANLQIYKNGSLYSYGPYNVVPVAFTTAVSVSISDSVECITGDTIQIRAFNNRTGGATTLETSGGGQLFNYLSIERA